MGTKYQTILVGGVVPDYDETNIPDDGSEVELNRVKFSSVYSDLTAPLQTAIVNMDTKLVDHVDEGPTPKSGNYTTTTGDHNSVIECTGSPTITLLAPSGNAGYQLTIKNAGSGTVTVDVSGGANIDGGASITVPASQANKVYVNNAGTAYYSVTGNGTGDGFASGTTMMFMQNAAPTGWTKKTDAAYNNAAIRVSTGTVSDVVNGSVNFDTVFGLTATDGHTLTEAQLPVVDLDHSHTVTLRSGTPLSVGGATTYLGTAGTIYRLTGTPTSNTVIVNSTSGHGFGSGDAHTHDIDLQVRYRDVITASKA